jgi:hypothetical protein
MLRAARARGSAPWQYNTNEWRCASAAFAKARPWARIQPNATKIAPGGSSRKLELAPFGWLRPARYLNL